MGGNTLDFVLTDNEALLHGTGTYIKQSDHIFVERACLINNFISPRGVDIFREINKLSLLTFHSEYIDWGSLQSNLATIYWDAVIANNEPQS